MVPLQLLPAGLPLLCVWPLVVPAWLLVGGYFLDRGWRRSVKGRNRSPRSLFILWRTLGTRVHAHMHTYTKECVGTYVLTHPTCTCTLKHMCAFNEPTRSRCMQTLKDPHRLCTPVPLHTHRVHAHTCAHIHTPPRPLHLTVQAVQCSLGRD